MPDHDARLLELGQQLESAWQREREATLMTSETPASFHEDILEAAAAETQQIVDEIFNAPAATIEGLCVKARAVQWQQGVTEGLAIGRYSDGMISIVEDLLRLKTKLK